MNHILFEVGIEELPARFIDDAEKQLFEKTVQWFDQLRIQYETIETFSTPRRLAVRIKGVSDRQQSLTEEVRGPSEKIAKDEEGNWTKAAIGFTKGQGMTTDDLYIQEVRGTRYTFVKKHTEGKKTIELLSQFEDIIQSIHFPETMRWGTGTFRFSRPIRWLVALYNDQVVPLTVGGVHASNQTFGHRFLGDKITLDHPLHYEEKMRKNFVIPKVEDRKKVILEQIAKLEQEQSFQIIVEEDLLQEVAHLVEYPTVFYGGFEETYLTLPEEVLITSMKEHQRYFYVQDKRGKMLPYFVGVRNGDNKALENVIRGNEKVLRARLSDAQFFYEEDQKISIDENLEKLKRVVFHEKLGTIAEKVVRVQETSEKIAKLLDLDAETIEKIKRAAQIAKFDLVTNMVNEFTELQGIMGEKYAISFGEDPAVAQAIREQYKPLSSEGTLPKSVIGSVLSIADKLDTIIGVISIGMKPTGSQDPYALRRQAIGILRILEKNEWGLPFEKLLKTALQAYGNLKGDPTEEIVAFFKLRANYLCKKIGIPQDVVEAVFHEEVGIYPYQVKKANVLTEKLKDKTFKKSQEAFIRVLNLAKQAEEITKEPNAQFFETASEQALFDVYQKVKEQYETYTKEWKAKDAFHALIALTEPIHLFFEENMIMVDEKELRTNRLALIKMIQMLMNDFADLSVIQWNQHEMMSKGV